MLKIIIRSSISAAMIAATCFVIAVAMMPQPAHQHSDKPAALNTVEVIPVQPHTSGINFSVDGEVIPFRRLDIISEIQGRVIYKSENCRLGHSVKQDDVLMRIDPVDYQLEHDKAAESVKQAKVNIEDNKIQLANTEGDLLLAKEQLELAQKDLDRNQSLSDKNTITAADFDNARSALLSAKDNVQKLENQLRVSKNQTNKLEVALRTEELALATAELNLKRCEILAPMSGVITADSFEVNSFIQKGADIAKILDTAQLEIQCSLYMKQIQWVWQQADHTAGDAASSTNGGYVFAPTPVTIIFENEGEQWFWDGTLTTLDGGIMNAATRMVPCRVKVDSPGGGKPVKSEPSEQNVKHPMLFAGMFVTVIVHSKPAIPLYRIPERALLPGNKIWTVVDGKLHQHSIRVATTTDEGVLFYASGDGIRANDLVVVSPLASPVEGGSVNVMKSGELAQH